jgi:Na+-transporting NADH:ubiquinone oxidoreductase subunit NqrC
MPPVQATPEYDLAVVPHRPYYYTVRAIVVIIIGILLAAGSYYSGHYRGLSAEQSAIAERDQLRILYADAKKEIKQLEQSIANLKLGSEVDRKATEQVRERVVELKNRIAELERDNTFYRDLMRPEGDDEGISVAAPNLELVPGADNTYEYKMVVKQLSTNRLQVEGYLEFIVVGKGENGKIQRFNLQQFSDDVASEKIKRSSLSVSNLKSFLLSLKRP